MSGTSGTPAQWGTPEDHTACGDAIAAARALGAREALLALAADLDRAIADAKPGTIGHQRIPGFLRAVRLAKERAQGSHSGGNEAASVCQEGQERSGRPEPAPSDPVESLVDYGPAIDAGIAKAESLNISPGSVDSPELIARFIAAEVLRVATPAIAAAARKRIREQIDPDMLDKLAEWFDSDNEFKVAMFPGKWPERGHEVQDDLRRWAKVIREVPGDD